MTAADNTRKACNKPVSQYYKNGDFVATYASAAEASRQTGINQSHIGECCKGKLFTAGNYLWRYENN